MKQLDYYIWIYLKLKKKYVSPVTFKYIQTIRVDQWWMKSLGREGQTSLFFGESTVDNETQFSYILSVLPIEEKAMKRATKDNGQW